MRWRRLMRALMFKRPEPTSGSAEAVQAAERSYARAVTDRAQAAELRAVAEEVTQEVRRHNRANHFDSWLQEIIQQNMR